MYLTKAKICGHQIIKNSSWFQFSRHLTFLAGPCGSGKTSLLRILQTINPHPLQNFDNPFATFPDHFLTKGYKRIVDPRKKTAALAIFKSNDEMRNQLAEIERSLINTDKIEVGRRLDWSRWLSFVEISSSTRWSEIEDKVAALTHHIADQSILSGLKTEFPELSQLTATDRVKGEAMHLLGNWLTAIKPHLAEKENDLFNSTLHSVYRYQRMRAAKKVVSSQLPSFLYLRSNLLLNTPLSLSRLLAQQQQPSPILEEFSANFLAHHLFSHTPSIDPKRISHFLDRLADRVEILSHSADRLTHTLDGDTLTLYQKRPTGQQLPLSEAGGTGNGWLPSAFYYTPLHKPPTRRPFSYWMNRKRD